MQHLSTVQQVNSAIMFGNFTNEELEGIANAVRYARAQLGKEKIRSFQKGDTVKFTSTKRGMTVTGTVAKVAIKYVTVNSSTGLWRVPANMLESV